MYNVANFVYTNRYKIYWNYIINDDFCEGRLKCNIITREHRIYFKRTNALYIIK